MKRLLLAALLPALLFGGLSAWSAPVTFSPVALPGDPVPGIDDVTVIDFFGFTVTSSNSGRVVYAVTFGPGDTISDTIGIGLFDASGPISLGLFEPPEGTSEIIGRYGPTAVNDRGDVVFTAIFDDALTGERETGIFNGSDLVVRVGDVVPGSDGAQIHSLSSATAASLNEAGDLGFAARISGPDGDQQRLAFIAGGRLVVATGDVIPGTEDAEITGLGLGLIALNDRGDTAYAAEFVENGESGSGLFANGALVARTGDAVPGLDDAEFASLVVGANALNDFGELAYRAVFRDDSTLDVGLFTSSAGLVVRLGDKVPDTDAVFTFLQPPEINNYGEVAFFALDSEGGRGLYFIDAAGVLNTIVRTGELFDDGQMVLFVNESPGSRYLSDWGLTFFMSLSDGTQGFFAAEIQRTQHAVPEPAAWVLIWIGLLGMLAVRTRRIRLRRPPPSAPT